ncbi:MAG: bifunctional metallophosphatase/5'-nucleotidase [Bradyrhizobium sp.]|jgi:2',3'-cyclic-nucleotide 2'-phosphodiesterase (5'-nucleotidase family)|uniref:bifunctional metallophosphatase/5'-nucleotidase n=1 Tax=Hyphomicrobiales TaxID=356 RepID=UPI0007DA7796|nr:bifunctional metallophosphatase/5'-nucleotidase [Shinella sp. HZN7]ANH05713.1 bifunctional metallophosphatase/5'-nucleotidase [Shinella sp. HZN7]
MAAEARRNITLIQVNDTHGYLEPHPELVWHGATPHLPTLGGYARIAGYLNKIRSECPDAVVALDNGDTFHGTYAAVSSKGEALVPLTNALSLDAMTAHWEFAWGPAHFKALAKRLDYPVLAINCFDQKTGRRPFAASRVIERGGVRIGVIGVAATIVDKTMPPHFSEGLRFTNGDKELPREIRRLRQKERVELIVVLSHLGLPQDIKLAGLVDGIDVILSGHTHDRLERPVLANGAIIIQSGCHGAFIGRLDLSVGKDGVRMEAHELVAMDETIDPDPSMAELVEGVMAPLRAHLSVAVGHLDMALHRNTILDCTMDDFLLAALCDTSGRKIAFSNGWRYGAPIPPGTVTMNDLWNIIPVNPPVSKVTMTGAEIREMMEQNLDRTFCADPFGQMSGYVKRFCGLTIFAKLENPFGSRIVQIFAGEEKLDPEAGYEVAFVTAQGVPSRFGRDRGQMEVSAIEALQAYLKKSPRSAATPGRVIPI